MRASEASALEGSEQSLSTVEAPSKKEALPSQTAVESSKSSGARNGYGDQNGCSEEGRVLNMWLELVRCRVGKHAMDLLNPYSLQSDFDLMTQWALHQWPWQNIRLTAEVIVCSLLLCRPLCH